jgi:uncharacterized surface protein with fasciclin (FAS1) repeats
MKKLTIALASAATLALAACGSPAEEDTTMTEDTAMADQMANDDMAAGTVVEVAQGNPDFSTLVSAVTSADLATTLSGTGPYTVFAPTNAAFEKVPQETRDELMSPAGQQDLANILTYHVVAGAVKSTDLSDDMKAATVEGSEITVDLDNGVMINDATVVQADIEASNGVIHVIDSVLMPGM